MAAGEVGVGGRRRVSGERGWGGLVGAGMVSLPWDGGSLGMWRGIVCGACRLSEYVMQGHSFLKNAINLRVHVNPTICRHTRAHLEGLRSADELSKNNMT